VADVLITHSYHSGFDPKQLRKMQPYMPLATLYAATALRERGISVAVFDPMIEPPFPGFTNLLATQKPGIVAVYEDDFNFLSKMCLTRMRDVAWEIADAAKASGAMTIVHGSDSTDHPRLFLDHGFDYVLRGEAEETLADLCQSILRGAPQPEIDGLVWLDDHGELTNSPRHFANNPAWTNVALPARQLIPWEPYREAWTATHGYFSVNMVSSRGCPYGCNWCAKPVSANKYRLRPPGEIAEEMSLLKHSWGAEHIWFADDIFGLDRGWVRQFSEEVTKRNASLPFKIQSRANLMSDETVRYLKVAGCAEVWMGVESGSQAVLDAMDKGLTPAMVRAARLRLKGAGIRACYFLQFGYPGETWADLQQTLSLVRETRPDDIGISFSYPLPGTLFYERVRRQLGEKRNWLNSDDLCIMFKAAYKTEFYRAVRDALHAEVESWNQPAGGGTVAQQIAAMWDRVAELESQCHETEPFAFGAPSKLASPSFVPVEQVLSVRTI
jgi:anaerobic magnesium-protoporphyrin IX monomethyl ester cyclase